MKLRRASILILLLLLAASFVLAQQPAATTVDSATLDRYVHELRYVELEEALRSLPPSAERDYFAGVLANRHGRLTESVSWLEKALPEIEKASPTRAAIALEALGDDYVKQNRYADALRVYADLFQHFESSIDKSLLADDRDDYSTIKLLKDAPAQTVTATGPVALQTQRHKVLGTIETTLTVNGVTESWILDTGANFSVVTRSMADRMKLKLLPGQAQTQGITGAENKLRIAILPDLPLGNATVHNVVLLVMEDQSLDLPLGKDLHVQINAILGYPVMQALGRITFTKNGHFLADPQAPAGDKGAPLLMHKLTPMLLARVEGRDLIFSFDSGATSTAFTDRYYKAFPARFNGLKKRPYAIGGAGGVKRFEAYFLPSSTLDFGGTPVTLKDVPVLPELGTSTDRSYGNLGRDIIDQFESFTIDFRSMRFELGQELPETQKTPHDH